MLKWILGAGAALAALAGVLSTIVKKRKRYIQTDQDDRFLGI